MSEKDPWKDVEAELLKAIGHPHVAVTDLPPDTFVARFFAARAAEATQHRQEIAAKDETIDGLRLVALGWEKQRDEARARLAAVEAERDRLKAAVSRVADALAASARLGAHEDSPEGNRVITWSDTFARQVESDLRAALSGEGTKP